MLSARSLSFLQRTASRVCKCPRSRHLKICSASFSSPPQPKTQSTQSILTGSDPAETAEDRAARIRAELEQKKGRGWTDPWDLDEMMASKVEFDDLPDWSPDLVSRISQERVTVHENGIPTLEQIAKLSLPRPPPPHPALQAKAYALHRKRALAKQIQDKVEALAAPKIAKIQAMAEWDDKQDAVDELFEQVHFTLKDREPVLGKHPHFAAWVEKALEGYLISAQNGQTTLEQDSEGKAVATPIFMDCYDDKVDKEDGDKQVVPKILSPLEDTTSRPFSDPSGKMVEEWSLSAHKTSRRILLRQCTQQVAKALLENNEPRILLSGSRGVGKSAALAAVVASARASGSIVLYLPEGDQLHQNGFYVEPNTRKEGIFDLPVLSQRFCEQFLSSHEKDLSSFQIDKDLLSKHFTEEQVKRLFRDDEDAEKSGSLSLVALLKFGTQRAAYAGSSYAAALDFLLYHQDTTPFVVAIDEINCFYKDKGHYFHADYDPDVKKSIPYDKISLFQPIMDALALSTTPAEETDSSPAKESPRSLNKGAVVAALTESHAVPRSVTDALVASADSNDTVQHCTVPRLSKIEVEHLLANYEATGVGKLRLDRGETVMNPQEVAYLHMVSGGVALNLMNACMI